MSKKPTKDPKGHNRAYIHRQFEGFLKSAYVGWAFMSVDQRNHLRDAFYGGAACLHGLLMSGVGDEQGNPTPEELKLLADVSKELEDFSKGILARIKSEGSV